MLAVLIVLWCPARMLGQAVVEHAVITSGTAVGTAAGAKGTGRSIGTVFSELNKKLGKGSSPDVVKRQSSRTAASEKELLEAKRIRTVRVAVEEIHPGMPVSELVEKFGKPMMKVSRNDGSEVYHYISTHSEPVQVVVKEETVASYEVKRVELSKRPDVVIIQ